MGLFQAKEEEEEEEGTNLILREEIRRCSNQEMYIINKVKR